jgi:DNA-binding response OmpR family regulator
MTRDRILIVEDDQHLSRLLIEVLTASGYDVAAQDSVFGAAAVVRELHPSAILLDLGLPFRPGTALLTELKADARTADVPVLIMSGFPEVLNEERRAMADAILAKPFAIRELLDKIRMACTSERRN